MKALRRALQNGPSPMPIRHSCRNLFKVFTAPTQRGRSIVHRAPSRLLAPVKRQAEKVRFSRTTPNAYIYIYIIGERERANLVVRLARLFIYNNIFSMPRALFPDIRYLRTHYIHAVYIYEYYGAVSMSLRITFDLPWLSIYTVLCVKMISDEEQACSSMTAEDRAMEAPTVRRTCIERVRNRQASESDQQRERRLSQDRARRRERLASESTEEREARLSRRRARDRIRRAAQSTSLASQPYFSACAHARDN